jgi:SAM-dependent methyltransferase
MPRSKVFEELATGSYAFVDAGSGTGGSVRFCQERFGRSPGLGLELIEGDALRARESGLHVIHGDATREEFPENCVSFASMMDFLEHLPDEATAVGVLEKLAGAARDFLFIRHPSFEDIDYLARFGMKITWTDWDGHPNMMTLMDYLRIFSDFAWSDYVINLGTPIRDSWNYAVLPREAARNAPVYDAKLHGSKAYVEFDRPMYEQFDIFVRLNPDLSEERWRAITAPVTSHDDDLAGIAVGAYIPGAGLWHLRGPGGGSRYSTFSFGPSGRELIALSGDWDGDGVDSPGVYDPSTGTFFLKNASSDGPADVVLAFGTPGALPVVGDWDGDGVDTVGIYFPSIGSWALKNSHATGPADIELYFGGPESAMLPIAGDWDGSGSDSIGLYNPGESLFYLLDRLATGAPSSQVTFGPPNALPVVGDWNGDGVDMVGLYDPDQARWHLRNANSSGPPYVSFTFGPLGARPLAGRWTR